MRKTKKHIVFAFIAILIAALAFGYAYLTTTLTISGITDIDRNSWDVYFDNVQVTDGSVTGVQEIESPTITSDTEVEFHVNLKKPGDFYEFTVEARNDGTIDAMINSVSKKLNNVEITTLPAYLNYTVTYDNGMEIEDNHLLAHESLETYKIRVEYKKNISASDLPTTAQSLTLSFGVEYVQADENAKEKDSYIYSNGSSYWLGSEITINNEYNFDNFDDPIAASGLNFCYRFRTAEGKISEIAVAFKTNGKIYNLIGVIDESELSEKPIYEENKRALEEGFGSNASCYEYQGQFECSYQDRYGYVRTDGEIYYCKNGYWEGQFWRPPLAAIINKSFLYFGVDN